MSLLLIDIGGTKCSFGFDGEVSLQEVSTADFDDPKQILTEIENWVRAQSTEIKRVAVSFGGQLNFATQIVSQSVHKSGWETFSFKKWAKEKFNAECLADNDANCGALGEWCFRERPASLVYVTISTGIGSGLVLNGELYRGQNNLAGELGHIQIDPNGKPDELGNIGTLERACGGYWILKDFGKPASELLGDEKFFQTYVGNLAKGLEIAVKLIAPEFMVLGGGITNVGSKLESTLQEILKSTLSATGTKLELTKLGKSNVLLGAKELR